MKKQQLAKNRKAAEHRAEGLTEPFVDIHFIFTFDDMTQGEAKVAFAESVCKTEKAYKDVILEFLKEQKETRKLVKASSMWDISTSTSNLPMESLNDKQFWYCKCGGKLFFISDKEIDQLQAKWRKAQKSK